MRQRRSSSSRDLRHGPDVRHGPDLRHGPDVHRQPLPSMSRRWSVKVETQIRMKRRVRAQMQGRYHSDLKTMQTVKAMTAKRVSIIAKGKAKACMRSGLACDLRRSGDAAPLRCWLLGMLTSVL